MSWFIIRCGQIPMGLSFPAGTRARKIQSDSQLGDGALWPAAGGVCSCQCLSASCSSRSTSQQSGSIRLKSLAIKVSIFATTRPGQICTTKGHAWSLQSARASSLSCNTRSRTRQWPMEQWEEWQTKWASETGCYLLLLPTSKWDLTTGPPEMMLDSHYFYNMCTSSCIPSDQ